MKKMTTIWMIIFMFSLNLPAMGAMSISKMRQNARFLTDKMTYELGLSMMQYDDVYEVNYDFINNIRYIMDDVVRGHIDALERYYECLDIRNDDLRWILSNSQYRRFLDIDYFYRPVYTTKNNWLFLIYNIYVDKNFFYYDKPHHYRNYNGEHCRIHHNHVSFYKTNHTVKYNHSVYKGNSKVKRNSISEPISKTPATRKNTNINNKNNQVKVEKKETHLKVESINTRKSEVKKENHSNRRTNNANEKSSTRSSSNSRKSSKERK